MGTVTLFSDFLRHFVVGKNNGGRVSFQTKHAQQVSCLSIIIVYIVLCSEIYTTAPERLQALCDRRTNTAQDRSVELCKPVLDTRNFSPLFRANQARSQGIRKGGYILRGGGGLGELPRKILNSRWRTPQNLMIFFNCQRNF